MPPVTLAAVVDLSKVKMKWKETYVSEGLNRKVIPSMPKGIYSGLKLVQNIASPRQVEVSIGSDTFHAAVHQSAVGYSTTYYDNLGTSTILNLSGAPLDNQETVITLSITYVIGADTVANWIAYPIADWNALTDAQRAERIVLGTINVPAPAVNITTAMITPDRRTVAWESESPGVVPWSPIVKNPSFEHGVTGAGTVKFSISDWANRTDLAVNGSFRTGTGTVRSGAKSLEFNKSAVGAGVGRLEQNAEIPVVPGQLIHVTGWVRQLIAPTAGSYTFNLYWGDLDSLASGSSVITASVLATTDASFRKVDKTIEVPAGKYVLKTITIEATGLTTGSTGVALAVDDFQVYVETGSPQAIAASANRRLEQRALSEILFEDSSTYSVGQIAALLRFDKSTPVSEGRVLLERKDQDYSGANLPPALEMMGRAFLGGQLLSTETKALLPRVTAPISVAGGTEFTLMWESARFGETTGTYTQPVVRTYSSSDGQWVFTSNAIWGGTTWTKDVAGQNATKMGLAKDGLRLYTRVSNAAWSDSSWDDTTFMTNPLSSATDARTPRASHGLFDGALTDLTLISEFSFALLKIRFYAMTNAVDGVKLMATVNASWDGTNWNRDTAATGASRITMEMALPGTGSTDGSQWKFQFVDATASATWTEATFDLSTNTQASINQYGAHFKNQAATQASVYVGPDESFVNDGGVFFQIALNKSYYTIAAGRGAGQYIYFPAPQVAIGWKLTGWYLIYDKQDTGATAMQGLLINAKDKTEVAATGASTINSVTIAGLTTTGYYHMGETGLTVNSGGFVQSIAVPGHLTTRPDIHYLRVFPSPTATGGTDKVFGVIFYYTYSY